MLVAATKWRARLVGSTPATIVVFVPLAFISGVTGGFKALAVTMVAALVLSLLHARYVLPLVAERWLTLKDAQAADKAERFAAGVLVLAGSLAFSHLESGFMPVMDEGGCILDYKAKPGAALNDTDRLLRQMERII